MCVCDPHTSLQASLDIPILARSQDFLPLVLKACGQGATVKNKESGEKKSNSLWSSMSHPVRDRHRIKHGIQSCILGGYTLLPTSGLHYIYKMWKLSAGLLLLPLSAPNDLLLLSLGLVCGFDWMVLDNYMLNDEREYDGWNVESHDCHCWATRLTLNCSAMRLDCTLPFLSYSGLASVRRSSFSYPKKSTKDPWFWKLCGFSFER